MKLLHIISSLEIGGAQRLLADLIPRQKAQGIDVALLIYVEVRNELTQKIEQIGLTIHQLKTPHIYSPLNIVRLRQIIKKYDVVHVHLFPSLYWAALASIGLRTKLVYTEHSTHNRRREKPYLRPIERLIYQRYCKIICISEQTKEALQTWLRTKSMPFIVIHNGVDTQRFITTYRPIVPQSLIMVSRFVASKDQETLIRAMRYIPPQAVLFLVGDGQRLEHCKKVAMEEGVHDRVHFLGARTDVAELIAASYIGIQSSQWEGFGLTAVELMSAGKPVVASNVDGLKQVVEGAGVIFQQGDSKSLAQAISQLLEDEHYYQVVAQACKKRASQYDITNTAKRYRDVYQLLHSN